MISTAIVISILIRLCLGNHSKQHKLLPIWNKFVSLLKIVYQYHTQIIWLYLISDWWWLMIQPGCWSFGHSTYPLVDVDSLLWKITMLFMGKSTQFHGHVQWLYLCLPEGTLEDFHSPWSEVTAMIKVSVLGGVEVLGFLPESITCFTIGFMVELSMVY